MLPYGNGKVDGSVTDIRGNVVIQHSNKEFSMIAHLMLNRIRSKWVTL